LAGSWMCSSTKANSAVVPPSRMALTIVSTTSRVYSILS
jgi:hypothetical protein